MSQYRHGWRDKNASADTHHWCRGDERVGLRPETVMAACPGDALPSLVKVAHSVAMNDAIVRIIPSRSAFAT